MNDKTEQNVEVQVKDPVCGMIKPKSQMKVQAVHKGTVYYFCSEGDKNMFVAHPEHWIIKSQ